MAGIPQNKLVFKPGSGPARIGGEALPANISHGVVVGVHPMDTFARPGETVNYDETVAVGDGPFGLKTILDVAGDADHIAIVKPN